MKKLIIPIIVLMLAACDHNESKVHYPSAVYHYVSIDTSVMQSSGLSYVPVYSHIYSQSGNRVLNLTATLSIRNTTFTDSIFISKVDYYGSQGEVLKKYIDSAVMLKPMSSIEFVVEENESKGGAGANFVVQHYSSGRTAPLIQAVMTGTNTGVSFTTSASEIK